MSRLSYDEEKELIIKVRDGDREAFGFFIENYIEYVKYIARKNMLYHISSGYKFSNEDIYQQGLVALIEAINKYSLDSTSKFSTYAFKWINGAVKEQIHFQLNRLGITETKYAVEGLSLDDDNGPSGILEDEDISVLDEIIRMEEILETKERIKQTIDLLTDTEKKVLYMVYGIACESTSNHKKIAKQLGLSEIEVKKAINSAMKKLKEAMEE